MRGHFVFGCVIIFNIERWKFPFLLANPADIYRRCFFIVKSIRLLSHALRGEDRRHHTEPPTTATCMRTAFIMHAVISFVPPVMLSINRTIKHIRVYETLTKTAVMFACGGETLCAAIGNFTRLVMFGDRKRGTSFPL